MRSSLATMGRAVAAALVLALAGAPAAASSLKGWRDGPVSDLLTADEYRRFGALRTDAARRTFIEGFWREVESAAGPSPDAYRETFERRCKAADDRFRTGGQPGSRTDRGRVFLALGEPALIQQESGGVRSVEREVWSYEGAAVAESPLRIAFFRCRDGSYRLDASCSAVRDPTSVAFDGERSDFLRRLRDRSFAGRSVTTLNGILLPVPGGVPLSQGVGSRFGAAPAPPGISSSVATTFPGVHALENATYFFRAQDGTVLTLLTLELLASRDRAGPVPVGPNSTYLGAASVEETGRRGEDLPTTSARAVALDAAPGVGNEGTANFFGRVYLEAGRTYAVRYAVKDGPNDEIFVRSALLGVPDLSRGFSTSSIDVASRDYSCTRVSTTT